MPKEREASIVTKAMDEIIESVKKAVTMLIPGQVEAIVDNLMEARDKKILVVGAGRSGLVGKAFAMRLMHLGYQVYVTGETIAPILEPGDVVVAISGSGTTRLVVILSKIAKEERGAKIVAITSYPDSPLGQLADQVAVVVGRTKMARREDSYISRQIVGEHEPLAPLGTQFEVAAMIFLDGIIAELMHRLGQKEEDLKARHATIE
ncbi:MAG: 6-phospho-3-hexuloisomerase [Promethearchaeati archaeon SRVP18_Atabeyarchaeia-1]